jgi:hypothetical protein
MTSGFEGPLPLCVIPNPVACSWRTAVTSELCESRLLSGGICFCFRCHLVYPACPELVCRRQASRGAKSKGHCSSQSMVGHVAEGLPRPPAGGMIEGFALFHLKIFANCIANSVRFWSQLNEIIKPHRIDFMEVLRRSLVIIPQVVIGVFFQGAV